MKCAGKGVVEFAGFQKKLGIPRPAQLLVAGAERFNDQNAVVGQRLDIARKVRTMEVICDDNTGEGFGRERPVALLEIARHDGDTRIIGKIAQARDIDIDRNNVESQGAERRRVAAMAGGNVENRAVGRDQRGEAQNPRRRIEHGFGRAVEALHDVRFYPGYDGLATRNAAMKAFVSALSATALAACTAAPTADRAATVHDRVITFDAEIDIPFDFMQGDKDAGRETVMQVDLPKMDRGRLDGAAFVIFVGQGKRDAASYAKARTDADSKLKAIDSMLSRYPERIVLARTARDAESAVTAGKHFAMLSVVNAYPFGESTGWLSELHAKGLRMVAFNHAGHNQWADSNRPQERLGDQAEEHGGLSALGREAIAEMNRLGIIVDVSQITSKAVMQAVDLSRTPVVASHVGVKSVVDTERNLSDAEMRAIAAKGGVIGIVAFNIYLKAPSAEQNADLAALEKRYDLKTFTEARSKLTGERLAGFGKEMDAYRARWPGATVADFVDSIDAAVRIVGIDHVGISTDMEHAGGVVGYKTVAEAPNVTAELVKRGYSERDIGKIWSGNFFRVWREVERAAVRAQRAGK